MRNLKRVLSLALALVMVLGMMVIGTSAATFTDAEEITYTEAVEVMAALDVFQGDNGALKPTEILNREQAATLMARIHSNGKVENLVATKQIFSDVPATKWSAKYIEYCYNCGLIDGMGNGVYNPDGELTGIQFAKLLLVALGYDADAEGYVGTEWKTNISVDALNAGLYVDGVDINLSLTREQAAQMLFQALEQNTVAYSTYFDKATNAPILGGAYADGNTFMGKYFPKLSKFEGVVTANEYANLYSYYTKYTGYTTIDGVTYKLSTDITDIGESRQGWALDNTVIYIEDTGLNTVWENEGAETSFYNAKGQWIFKNVTGMYADYAEYFENFAYGQFVEYTSDYMITYGYEGDKLANGNDAPHKEVNVRAGKAINYSELKAVFADNNGYVYVGTKNTDAGDDKSSTMSWKEFVKEYLQYDAYRYSFSRCDNGEWLKVIDNDGDGYADYVLRLDFLMTEIVNISKKGVYTLADGSTLDPASRYYDIVAEDVKAGDIVIVTFIDNVYYINLAEVAVDTIDKKGIDKKNETVTCGDTVYEQSGIDKDDVMATELVAANTQLSYDFYLDFFGYVRMYEPSAYDNGFVLLTDGYYWSNNRSESYKATIFDVLTEELVDVDVVDAKKYPAGNFILDYSDWDAQEEAWERLMTADWTYGSPYASGNEYWTNIAAYIYGEDGYTLGNVEGSMPSNYIDYMVQALDVSKSDVDDKTLTAYAYNRNGEADETTIQVTTDTVYYFVLKNAKGKLEVTTWTGYNNAPAEAVLADNAQAYAVTVDGVGAYNVAEIVVFETVAATDSALYLVYDETNYDAIAMGFADGELDIEMYVEVEDTDDVAPIDYYIIDTDGEVVLLDTDAKGEYAGMKIYAATVETATRDVNSRDYVRADVEGKASDVTFYENYVDVYVIEKVGKSYVVSEASDSIEIGDQLIYMTDAKGNILYVINVTLSDTDALDALWAAIKVDAETAALNSDIEVEVKFGETVVADGASENVTYADAKNVTAWTITGLNGTEIHLTEGEDVVVTTAGGVFELTVVARSEDGSDEAILTYAVEVAAARTTTWFDWTAAKTAEVSSDVAALSGNNVTVKANWLEAKGMTLVDFIDRYVVAIDGATGAAVANTDGTVTYTVTAEDGVTATAYTFAIV